MARPKAVQPRVEVTVGMPEKLRALLEAAARRSVRSLAGEIVFRLRTSFADIDDDSSRAA